MRLLKPFLISAAITAALFFSSCRKDKNHSTPQQPTDNTCVTGRGAATGNIIPGQYIVSLKSSSTGTARIMSAAQVDDIGKRLLQTHAIKEGMVEKSFPGVHGGFDLKPNAVHLGK